MRLFTLLVLASVILLSCSSDKKNKAVNTTAVTQSNRAKFEPEDGKILLFVGQELDALGGLEDFNDGYYDHFEAPGGFTMYTDFMPNKKADGTVEYKLDGLRTTDNWGDGESNMSLQIADEDFANSALAIGLSMVDNDSAVASGELDMMILELGHWIKELGKRPVFLRIGYEFDGDWNHYAPEAYVQSFKRVHDIFDSLRVDNVAYVWQATGWGSSEEKLLTYYPGDEYVDWCAYSKFNYYRGVTFTFDPLLKIAKDHGKPVFIAETTPMLNRISRKEAGPMDMDIPEQAEEAWAKWFVPFFQHLEEHQDQIKAISYINANWKERPMWQVSPFGKIDARLQQSDYVSQLWRQEISKSKYIKASPDLFDQLWNH